MEINEILNKDYLTKEDIVFLLQLSSPADINLLYDKSKQVRNEFCGRGIKLRGNLKFSNYCENNCLYCRKREDNFSLSRYRVSADEIIETIKHYSNIGFDEIILQSGRDSYYDTDIISYIIYSVKQNINISISLSLGERGFDEYNAWRIAGADRYILKHKTANNELFSIFHNKERLSDRINHLKYLKRIGFKIGSGSIIGLPMQTKEDIADDILLCKELGVELLTFNPFVPMQFTPYQNQAKGSKQLVGKTIAVARLVMKNADIQTYSAVENGELKVNQKCLNSGANILIANFSPSLNLDLHPSIFRAKEELINIPAFKRKLKTIIKDLD